jgi:hypothetical protein
MVPSWVSPGRRLTGSVVPSVAIGALIGGLVGALATAVMVGSGIAPELPDDPIQVPAFGALVWGLIAWLGGGWVIGALVQTLGVPDGVEPIDMDEVGTVKARLVSAFGLPLLSVVAIGVLVLSFAFVFLSFPSYSPLTGTIIAASILGFASLSASKPNMKVGLSELMVAAAGIGVAVILVFAVLQTSGAGHQEDEGEHGGDEATAEEAEGGSGDAEPAEDAASGDVEPAEGDAIVIVLPV